MKLTLKLEELAMFLACVALLYMAEASWWWYLLLLLGPDLSMIGYLAGNKAGALLYNIFHHKAVGILLCAVGMFLLIRPEITEFFNSELLIFSGLVIFGHSSMDRFFGYGLKYKEGFKYTHLGFIGKQRSENLN